MSATTVPLSLRPLIFPRDHVAFSNSTTSTCLATLSRGVLACFLISSPPHHYFHFAGSTQIKLICCFLALISDRNLLVMSSVPLHCTICPKRPNFSDISHLLTHVSSKGHLSHLHKLQVRSHQDIDAGQQLTIYNNWYQINGIGQLLSERLFQKQAKKAQARTRTFSVSAANHRRRQSSASTSTTDLGLAPRQNAVGGQTMLQHPTNGLHHRTRHLAYSREHSTSVSIKSDEESEYDSSPIRRIR